MNWFTWAILSAFFAELTAVLAKIGVAGVDSTLATAIRTTVILLFTWALFFAFAPARSLRRLDNRNWLFLVLSGLATGLSRVCYFRAPQLGEASRVPPIDKLSVVFAITFAAIILHERLTWHQWTGGAFIVVGAVILAMKG
jgi:transporter family protein